MLKYNSHIGIHYINRGINFLKKHAQIFSARVFLHVSKINGRYLFLCFAGVRFDISSESRGIERFIFQEQFYILTYC